MPTIAVTVPEDVGDALSRQARALLLGRRQYVRALLAAVARGEAEFAATPGAAVVEQSDVIESRSPRVLPA